MRNAVKLRLEMACLAAAFILPAVLAAIYISMYLGGLFFLVLMPFYLRRQAWLRKRMGDSKGAEAIERQMRNHDSGWVFRGGLKWGAVMSAIVLAAALILPLLA